MTPPADPFAPFAARMQAEGLPDVVIRNFAHYHAQLAAGETGLMPEASIEPVTDVPHHDDRDAGLLRETHQTRGARPDLPDATGSTSQIGRAVV